MVWMFTKLILFFIGTYIVVDIVVKIKNKKLKERNEGSPEDIAEISDLVSRVNTGLNLFYNEDKATRAVFYEKIQELEKSNNYEQTEELSSYIERYNKIVRRFEGIIKEKEIDIDVDRELLQEYIDKVYTLYEKLKNLRLKVSRITFIKIESEREETSPEETIKVEEKRFFFFNNTKDIQKIKATYRGLAKIYHPDSPTGDEAKFVLLQREYEELMQEFS